MLNAYSPLELLGAFAICVGVGYLGRMLQESREKRVVNNAIKAANACTATASAAV